MFPTRLALTACALIAAPSVKALPLAEPSPRAHWECVPFARAVSGVQIFGDAYTWWEQAAGRYARGARPRVGAVLSFAPHGTMRLGHVATVSEVIDARTVLVTHANWSPINGRRGQIERDVKVIDVSARGDWREVRVWFGPLAGLGTTAWPTHGFIYPAKLPDVTVAAGKAPKLDYAAVYRLPVPPRTAPSSRGAGTPQPTGRLDYLEETLGTIAAR